jgi:hypothetical protein
MVELRALLRSELGNGVIEKILIGNLLLFSIVGGVK